MYITINFQRGFDVETQVSVDGDIITIDNIDYDLSPLEQGGIAYPPEDCPIIGAITRPVDEICLEIIYQYLPDQPIHEQRKFHIQKGALNVYV